MLSSRFQLRSHASAVFEPPVSGGSGFGVWGLGFRVSDSGFRVQGSGFRVQDLGCGDWGSESKQRRFKALGLVSKQNRFRGQGCKVKSYKS